jgi:hypothetical protein
LVTHRDPARAAVPVHHRPRNRPSAAARPTTRRPRGSIAAAASI